MGTVPDPLRAAKASLIAEPGDVQTACSRPQPAPLGRGTNGLVGFPAEPRLSPGPAAAALMPAFERETAQPGMSAPGVGEAEKASPAHGPPGNPQLPGSREPPAPASSPTGRKALHTPPTMPDDQHARQAGPGGQPSASTSRVPADSVGTSPGTSHGERPERAGPAAVGAGDGCRDQGRGGFPSEESPGGAARTPAACASAPGSCDPAAKEDGCAEPPDAACPRPPRTPESEPVRVKEASTMTGPAASGTGEGPGRALRDAGVQAVASVQSRAVATSPSILTAFLRGLPAPEPSGQREQLRVTCRGAGSGGPVCELAGPQAPSAAVRGGSQPATRPGQELQGAPAGAACGREAREEGVGSAAESPAEEAPRPGANPSSGDQTASIAGGGADPELPESVATSTGDHETGSGCEQPDSCARRDGRAGSPQPAAGGGAQERKPESPLPAREQEAVGPAGLDARGLLLRPPPRETGATAPTPSPLTKSQEGVPEDSGQPRAAASLSLPGAALGDASPGSGKRTPSRSARASPRRGSRVSEFLAAAQVGLTPGEKKRPVGADARLKQAKRVRDVVWDEQGMTWEVYGASLDPESLGIAIQNHLQRQIREQETAGRTHGGQARRSASSESSSTRKRRGRQRSVLQAVLRNFRRPTCCVRPAPSSVLD